MADRTIDPGEEITLTIRIEGEMAITVNRAEYEAAKAAGEVDHFLDTDLSDFDGRNVVTEPDGRSYNPHEQPHGPTGDLESTDDSFEPEVNDLFLAKCGNPHDCTHGCDIP